MSKTYQKHVAVAVAADTSVSTGSASSLMDGPILKIVGVVGVGGAGFAFMQKSKAAREAEEEERQREELEADIAQKTTDFNSFITSFKTMVIESVSKMHR